MRALGLIGFLVVIAVIIWIMSAAILPHTQQVLKTKDKVEPQVKQMAGRDAAGFDARDSIKLEAESSGGRLKAVKLVELAPTGAMAKYFGLQKGDAIVEIAPGGGAFMPVSDMGGAAEAKDLLLSSYQNSQQIVVLRAGKRLTLPAAPAAADKPAESVQQQPNGVIKIPTH